MPTEDSKPAGSKKKNSSKTARVLGLLTSPPAMEDVEPPPAPKSAPEPPAQKPSQPPNDETVEAEVRGALEQALAEAELEAPPRPVPEPAVSAPVPREHAPAAYAPEPPAAGQEPRPEPPAPKPEAQPAPQPETALRQDAASGHGLGPQSELEDVFCFNITQTLVEQKVDKYIELFGLCRCPRCRIDVIALALSNLPAKYVVARRHEMVPLLSIYEGKYNAAIISQVMNACKQVMEHPRHEM